MANVLQESVYLLDQSQSENFALDTNRIYRPGYSEVREPNWGLRNRITGWSDRVRQITGVSRPTSAGYIPIPQSESVSIPIEEETSFSVPISEVSETAPLLTSSAAGAAGSSAVATTGISTGTLVAGTGIAVGSGIAAGAIGYLAHKLSGGATLPGHQFIGPGNVVKDQIPVDKDDEIAKEHDLAYQKAKTSSDVIKADHDAINKFDADYNINGNIHSKVGSIGLQLKTAIEQKFGVIYPSVSGTYF